MTPAIESIVVSAPRPMPAQRSGWRLFLSELNPLQYLPVVGTIYRAATGDTIPETARMAGSLVISGLTGGPVGVAISLAATLAEKAMGLDPERIGAHLLAGIGVGDPAPAAAAPHAAPASPAPSARAWSAAELAAYGVSRGNDGTLRRGTISGADVLNGLELGRLTSGLA